MLFGAAQEGRFTLDENQQSVTKHFFDVDQGSAGSGWVDSGQTVTGMAGTVTLMASNAQFVVGDLIRIDGHESEVTSKWTSTGLVLTPYKAHTTGEVIEVWAKSLRGKEMGTQRLWKTAVKITTTNLGCVMGKSVR